MKLVLDGVIPFNIPTDKLAIAGISGGETSALMGALLPSSVVLSFQNTGREHSRTYDFVGRLEEALERPIVRLEFRPPKRKGDRPCTSRVELVRHDRLDRSGAPFEMLLETLNNFRATKGKGPIAPWWRSRICTTYLKTRTARTYVEKVSDWKAWNEYVGLRADEPDRVARLRVGVPRRIGRFAPLSEANITKADVRRFWDAQAFKLGLDPMLGNCTGCFLKDQTDLSRALVFKETDAEWWIRMAKRYPGWGGKNFAGYDRLRWEAPTRIRIEKALRAGKKPESDGRLDAKRFRLVVIQERKRLAGEVQPFACECEGSQALANLDDDEEDAYILGLPEEAAA